MAGFDRIVYSTRERLLSSDMNEDARLRARNVMEAMRFLTGNFELNLDNDAVQGNTFNPTVLGGLKVFPAVGGVSVSAGLMIQLWPGIGGGGPSSDESDYVVGQLWSDTVVPIAVPVSDTWYLIQAQCSVDTTTATRDQWNDGTESFDPVTVGFRTTNVVALDAKEGTGTQIPLPDVGWIPLGAVKRLASGADSTSKEMVDMRPLYDRKSADVQTGGIEVTDFSLDTTHFDSTAGTAGNGVTFSVAALNDLGNMFARTRGTTAVDVTQAAIIDPNATLSANTWYYLYLALWFGPSFSGCLPRQAYDNVTQQGLLVLSHLGPTTQGSRDMPSTVTYPDPFNASSKVGVCVAALLRNPGNDGWYGMSMVHNRVRLFNASNLMFSGASPKSPAAGKIPTVARRMDISFLATSDSVVDVKTGSVVHQSMYPRAGLELQGIPSIQLRKLVPASLSFESSVSSDPISATLIGMEI